MNLKKTIAIFAGVAAIGAANADQYTDALNIDTPKTEDLADFFKTEATKISPAVLEGALSFIQKNVSEVKSGKKEASSYAEEMGKQLLTPDNPLIGILPTKVSQSCLTVYASQLMEKSRTELAALSQTETSLKRAATQVIRAESAEKDSMAQDVKSAMAKKLIMHDVEANLSKGLLDTAKACFDLMTLLNDEKISQTSLKIVQESATAGLDIISNYTKPFEFSEEQAQEIIGNSKTLKAINADKLAPAERNKAIEQDMYKYEGAGRVNVYMNAFKDAGMQAHNTVQDPVRTKSGVSQTVNFTPNRTGRV